MEPLILLFGKNGQVGYELSYNLKSLGRIMAVDSDQADFTNKDKVLELLEQYQPDVIINAAAYTAVDKAESEKELAFQINSITPKAIAHYAAENNSLFIHYSTDFVFDGNHDKPYLETDKPSPLGVYGQSKLAGDEAILKSNARAIILRTSWVYGLRGQNFLLTMLRLAHDREQMKVVSDQLGSPVWCRHIALTTELIVQKILQMNMDFDKIDDQYFGLFNLSASNHTSWYGFAKAILELDPKRSEQSCKILEAIPSSDYPTPAFRPKWSVLDNSKIKQIYGLTMPTWEDQLRECMS